MGCTTSKPSPSSDTPPPLEKPHPSPQNSSIDHTNPLYSKSIRPNETSPASSLPTTTTTMGTKTALEIAPPPSYPNSCSPRNHVANLSTGDVMTSPQLPEDIKMDSLSSNQSTQKETFLPDDSTAFRNTTNDTTNSIQSRVNSAQVDRSSFSQIFNYPRNHHQTFDGQYGPRPINIHHNINNMVTDNESIGQHSMFSYTDLYGDAQTPSDGSFALQPHSATKFTSLFNNNPIDSNIGGHHEDNCKQIDNSYRHHNSGIVINQNNHHIVPRQKEYQQTSPFQSSSLSNASSLYNANHIEFPLDSSPHLSIQNHVGLPQSTFSTSGTPTHDRLATMLANSPHQSWEHTLVHPHSHSRQLRPSQIQESNNISNNNDNNNTLTTLLDRRSASGLIAQPKYNENHYYINLASLQPPSDLDDESQSLYRNSISQNTDTSFLQLYKISALNHHFNLRGENGNDGDDDADCSDRSGNNDLYFINHPDCTDHKIDTTKKVDVLGVEQAPPPAKISGSFQSHQLDDVRDEGDHHSIPQINKENNTGNVHDFDNSHHSDEIIDVISSDPSQVLSSRKYYKVKKHQPK